MNDRHDHVIDMVDQDRVFESALAGVQDPGAPPWAHELTRLVTASRVRAGDAELAAEGAVVAAMTAVRAAVRAGEFDGDPDARLVPRPNDTVIDSVIDPVIDPVVDTAIDAAIGALPTTRRHEGPDEDDYVPRHAAPSPATPAVPAARQVGRVLVMKAAAVTTAVVVGTVAAAAATTQIVSNVVVPTITRDVGDSQPTEADTDGPTGERGGGGDDADAPESITSCPGMDLLCSPLAPAGSPTPADGAGKPEPADQPDEAPADEPAGATTTTTVAPPTTSTTEPPRATASTTTTAPSTTATTTPRSSSSTSSSSTTTTTTAGSTTATPRANEAS